MVLRATPATSGPLTPRELVRLIVLGPADMPSGCAPRSTCIGDLTPVRATAEGLVADGNLLVRSGFLVGEQFGYEREGELVAQHGVLLFAFSQGAHDLFHATTRQPHGRWQKAVVGVGEEGVLATASRTSLLVWRTGTVLEALMMRGADRGDIVQLGRQLNGRARRLGAWATDMISCDAFLAAIQLALESATSEVDGERIGNTWLNELLETRPHCTAALAGAARGDPRLASALAHSSASPRLYDLLGKDTFVRAYVSFAQPEEPGWWDSWSMSAVRALLDDDPDEGWALLVALVDAAPSDAVLEDVACQFFQDVVDGRLTTNKHRVQDDATNNPNVRRALLSALELADPDRAQAFRESIAL